MSHENEVVQDHDAVRDHNDRLAVAKAVLEARPAHAVSVTVNGYGEVTLQLHLGTEACERDWGNGPYTQVRARVALTSTEGVKATHPTMCPAWGVQYEDFKILRRKVEDRIRKDAEAVLKCAAILGIR